MYCQAIQNLLQTKLSDKISDLFALERNEGLKTIIGTIYQSFDGKDVYPTTEEKAINFLFIDGNKRIAATLFIYFLNYYNILYVDLVINFLSLYNKRRNCINPISSYFSF